jgi:putrescine importer
MPAIDERRLTRTLGLGSVVLFGLAYMTPLIVLGIFGIVAETTGGATPSAYLLAAAAMLFTAFSYGRMAAAFPVAGSAYTYVRKAIDPRVGFLVGWAILLDYLFLPMVIWLIGGAYLQGEYPGVPFAVWILGFIVLTTTLNILGIRVADKANFLLMTAQILVVAFFVVLSIAHVVGESGASGVFSTSPFTGESATLSAISSGAAIAAYSFLGFDAITTLSEETVEPRKTIPRAILIVALIGGAIFVLVAYTTQLVHPGGTFGDASSAAFDIAKVIGGSLFGSIFLAGLVVAQFASGIAAQASASRLLYAMGRDRLFPRRVFAYVQPTLHTPALSILAVGLIGLIALHLDVATSTSFINFGAFTAFTLVNLSVIALCVRERRSGRRPNTLAYLVAPTIGAAIDVWLLTQLDGRAITLGLSWLAIGGLYLIALTRGLRTAPPEMQVSAAR